eukprot:356656_1
MKRLARALSKEYKEIETFQNICSSMQLWHSENKTQILSNIKQHNLSQIGDDMTVHIKRIFKPSQTTHATLIDPVSRNHICNKPQTDLSAINITDLQLNAINTNKQLTGIIIESPIQTLSLSTVIQDEQKRTIPLHIYNYSRIHSLQNKFPIQIGSKVTIKEPYCKITASGNIGIRIDNPFYNLLFSKTCSTDLFAFDRNSKPKIQTMIHNDIEIKFINDRIGRGVIAKQNIDANTIIIKDTALLFERYIYIGIRHFVAINTDDNKKHIYSVALHNLRFEMFKLLSFGDKNDAKKLSLMYDGINNGILQFNDVNMFRNNVISDDVIRAFNVSEITSMINCNCWRIPDEKYPNDKNKEGTAVFVLGSMFNHSNNNNLLRENVWIKGNPVAVFTTKKFISKGDELTVDYGYDPALRANKNW